MLLRGHFLLISPLRGTGDEGPPVIPAVPLPMPRHHISVYAPKAAPGPAPSLPRGPELLQPAAAPFPAATPPAQLPGAKLELKWTVSEWPKIPRQDMSRKHKLGWGEMATNVGVISPEKAGKALNIKCDFQEMNLLP